MAELENKVVTVGSGSMNSQIAKLNRDGWRVVSTASAHLPGFMFVTLEREAVPNQAKLAEERRRARNSANRKAKWKGRLDRFQAASDKAEVERQARKAEKRAAKDAGGFPRSEADQGRPKSDS